MEKRIKTILSKSFSILIAVITIISLCSVINLSFPNKANAASWEKEEIDIEDGHDIGLYNSVAIDSLGYIHISYYDYDGGSSINVLKYATNQSGSWESEVVDTGDGHNVGSYSSIAIDSSDNVHISHYDINDRVLRYTTNQSGSWESEVVDTGDGHSVGSDSSIAIDSSDNLHISYYDDTATFLKYATTSVTPPNPTLSIDSGTSTTTDIEVNLTFSSYGDATYMIIGNESDLSDGTAIPFSATTTHTLSTEDGTKTVYARVGNAQGASSIVSDTITLDTSVDDDSDDSDDSADSADSDDTDDSDTPTLSPKILTTSGPGEPTRLQAYSKATTDGSNTLFSEDVTGLFPDSYLGGAGLVSIDINNNTVLDQVLLYAINNGGPQVLARGIKADGSFSSLGQHFVFQAPDDEPGTSSIRDGLSVAVLDADNDGFQDDAAFCLTGDYEPTVKVFTDVSGIDNWTLLNQFTIPDVGPTGCNLGTFQYDTGAEELLITPNHGPAIPNVYIYTVGGTEKEVFQAYDDPINQGLTAAGIEDRIYTTPNNGSSQVNAFDKTGERRNFWWVYEEHVRGDFTIRAAQLDPTTTKQELIISPVGSNGPHVLGYQASGIQKATPNFFAFGDPTLRNGVGIATIENWHGVN